MEDTNDDVDVLADLADRLGEARGPDACALLIRMDRPPGQAEVELGVLEVATHPLDALEHFTAPPATAAIAVVAHGWATGLDDGTRQRARVTMAIGRNGRTAGVLRRDDGHVIREAPGAGAVLDALRRSLGLSC